MTENDEGVAPPVHASTGYVEAQWWKAFETATTHDDPQVRTRAGDRARQWSSVLTGMLAGTLRVGSRTPVRDLPAWVTPVVVRGGFATGEAAAAGPVTDGERVLAARAGAAPRREVLFGRLLTPQGLAVLASVLDSGRYRVEVPEEAALLAVAWLVGAGDLDAAARVVREIEPHAATLRFTAAPDDRPVPEPDVVWRETAGTAAGRLARRRDNPRVAAMNEALGVWAPFSDALLALWLETADGDGTVGQVVPPGWVERAVALLGEYEELARRHTLTRRHRDPKGNVTVLRSALADAVAAHPAPPAPSSRVQHAVDAVLARRGRPGSAAHAALRAEQARVASAPTHAALARAVADRLGAVPPDSGLDDPDAVLGPVGGRPVPPAVVRTVRRATAGTVERLVALGVVPSAEVLAALVPQVTATVVAEAYPDERLRTLVAATYRAFRARRSLLLLDLRSQVRFDELPWVRALAAHRSPDAAADERRATALRLGRLALDSFPATILPNPFVAELATLLGPQVPLTEELAADIFMGAFSAKFSRAAQVAGRRLDGSLYARYYRVDTGALQRLPDRASTVRGHDRGGLASLAAERAGIDVDGTGWWSVSQNGRVVEQAQVLTTHNLAVLVDLGVEPATGWAALARGAFDGVVRFLAVARTQEHPLGAVKNAAYAWRQTVFFLSQCDDRAVGDFLVRGRALAAGATSRTDRARLEAILDGLDAARTAPMPDGRMRVHRRPAGEPFYGWTTGPHWLLAIG